MPTTVPTQINDGDWRVLPATPMARDYEFPFSAVGDNTTFKAKLKYRIDKEFYRPRAAMSVQQFPIGTGYLTKLGDPRDVGNGICESIDTYSSKPITRTEYGSFPYTYQWWKAIADVTVDPSKYFYSVNFDVEEQTFTVASRVIYEYFLFTQPPPRIKPRVFLLFGVLQSVGGTPPQTDSNGNTYVIAEDSSVTIYEGKIYERRTPQVQILSPAAV